LEAGFQESPDVTLHDEIRANRKIGYILTLDCALVAVKHTQVRVTIGVAELRCASRAKNTFVSYRVQLQVRKEEVSKSGGARSGDDGGVARAGNLRGD
jgi:hypothetical protein